MVERQNRCLGDSLRALLLKRGAGEWDLVLPQLMRAFRGTPHSATGETANMLLLGRKLRLPNQLVNTEADHHDYSSYVLKLLEWLEQAQNMLRERQPLIKNADSEEPPLFKPGDRVLLVNKRRRRGKNSKLQPRFFGPYISLRASITIHMGLKGRAKRVYKTKAV